jgi:D-alanyl-D-alanine carboxypeptidase (penicillin-binding protein 5/6)
VETWNGERYINTKDMLRDFIKPVIIFFIVICIFFIALRHNTRLETAFADSGRVTFSPEETLDDIVSEELTQENAVVSSDENMNSELFPDCYSALLVDDTDGTVYAAKNVHKRIYPASMTKLMTAIVVCEQMEAQGIDIDSVVTVENNYDLTAQDGGVNPLSLGCKITVRNLLAGLLIQSNNYYALILADYFAGSEENFCSLMNAKAMEIGATNTHFANPHGLDDVNHYTTAYDMYLIIKEASKHSEISDLDDFSEYTYTYENSSGYDIEVNLTATNLFLGDEVSLPAGYSIENWKTGTTGGAGYCLAMRIKDTASEDGHTYYVIAANGESKQQLYADIVKLICLIKN